MAASLLPQEALDEFFARIKSFAINQVNLVLALPEEIQVLGRILLKIKELILDLEDLILAARDKPETTAISDQKLLLASLRDFAYDAEDILDEFHTEILRRLPTSSSVAAAAAESLQQQNRVLLWAKVRAALAIGEQGVSILSLLLKPLSRYFPSTPSSAADGGGYFDQLPLFFQIRLAGRIKNLYAEQEKVRNLQQRVDAFISGLGAATAAAQDGASHPLREETNEMLEKGFRMVGRDATKKKLIKKLLGSEDPPSVLLIAGMGGIGKTTLAQDIFRDPEVADWFKKFKQWVSVGDKELDPGKVMGRIVDVDSADQLKIQSAVQDKRFLIILDDVWKGTNLRRSWEKLWVPLSYGGAGSRVIVTTREEDVGREMVGVAVEVERLWPLADEACVEIFERFAFPDHGTSPPDEALRELGREIVSEKIRGVPLAAKVVGSSLRDERREAEWRKACREITCGDVSSAIMWSYRRLPLHLKRCFTHLALHPKDRELRRSRVIWQWMAHQLFSAADSAEPEDAGEDCFDRLVRASLIQLVDNAYVVHDLVHDLAIEVAGNEYLCHSRSETTNVGMVPDPRTLRHLAVAADGLPLNHAQIRKLRTFISDDPSHLRILSDGQLATCRIVAICPRRGGSTLEARFTSMLHLRYLDLELMDLDSLPDSLPDLRNLQTLLLHENIKRFPGNMWKLRSLRHLRGGRLISTIHRIGELTSLQAIESFSLFENEGERVRELGRLRQLRGKLKIRGLCHLEDARIAQDAQMENKPGIRELALDYSRIAADVRIADGEMQKAVQIFEGLRPHRSLEDIKLKRYPGHELPAWVGGDHLRKLRSLTLALCGYLKKLPPLGHLPNLQRINFYGCFIGEIGREIYGSSARVFPSLREISLLDINGLEGWEELTLAGNRRVDSYFPSLKKIFVNSCRELRRLPHVPTSLEELDVSYSAVDSLPRVWGCCGRHDPTHSCHLPALKSLELVGCPVSDVGRWLRRTPSLSKVSLDHLARCGDLAIDSCGGLRRLRIKHLDGLRRLALRNLPLLERLDLNCKNVEELDLAGLPSLKEAHVCSYRSMSTVARDAAEEEEAAAASQTLVRVDQVQALKLEILEANTWGFLRVVDPRGVVSLKLVDVDLDCEMSDGEREWLRLWWRNLSSIRDIAVEECDGDSCPAWMDMRNLSSLRKVKFSMCYELQDLPEMHHFLGEDGLIINNCPFLGHSKKMRIQ